MSKLNHMPQVCNVKRHFSETVEASMYTQKQQGSPSTHVALKLTQQDKVFQYIIIKKIYQETRMGMKMTSILTINL